MASAIRLCYGPTPANHPRLASGTTGLALRPSRVHLGLNRPSHFLSNCSKNHQVTRPVWRVNCSKNEKNVAEKRGPLMGGARALALLVEMLECASDEPCRPHLPDEEPALEDMKKWKSYAKGLSKSGNPQTALNFLDEERRKCEAQNWSEAEQFLRMASIDLLIYQKNYQKVEEQLDQVIDDIILCQAFEQEESSQEEKNRLDQVISDIIAAHKRKENSQEAKNRLDQVISDIIEASKRKLRKKDKISKLVDIYQSNSSIAWIFLYKAIVQTMLEGKFAAQWWEAFENTRT